MHPQPIESRRRPPVAFTGPPGPDEFFCFRLPLPAAREALPRAAWPFVWALLAGVGMVTLARVYDAVPGPVALALAGGGLVNLFAAALRALAPAARVSEIAYAVTAAGVCLVVWSWHGRAGAGGVPDLSWIAVVIGIVYVGALVPVLVRGRTPTDSLLWAGAYFGALAAVQLPCSLSERASYYLLFLPAWLANLWLAWGIGAHYCRCAAGGLRRGARRQHADRVHRGRPPGVRQAHCR